MKHGRTRRLGGGLVLVLIVLTVALGFAPVPAASAQEAELEDLNGSGSGDDPYVITSAEQLQAMEQDLDADYVLGEDIDASATAEWNDGAGFSPIGVDDEDPFQGRFDGRDHRISGLTIDRPSASEVGLFAATGRSSEIRNVELVDVDVVGGEGVGGLVAFAGGPIEAVTVTGEVRAREGGVGGVAGFVRSDVSQLAADVRVTTDTSTAGGVVGSLSYRGSLTDVAVTGDVSGSQGRIGGIAGTSEGPIRRAVTTASVSGSDVVGGLVGYTAHQSDAAVDRTLVAGPVDGSSDVGGVVGYVGTVEVIDTYWDDTVTDVASAGGSEHVDVIRVDHSEATGADAPTALDRFDFGSTFQATEDYPVHQWRVNGLALEVGSTTVGEGSTTPVTAELTLAGGGTIDVTDQATYDSETAVAAVEDGELSANAQGVTELEASLGEHADAVEIEVTEPPSIELQSAELLAPAAVEGAGTSVTATYENDGGPGSRDVAVTVDGETVASETVTVPADESTTVQLSWTPETGGAVAVDGTAAGDLSLVAPGTVSLEDVSLPDEIGAGGHYDVDVELANDADTAVAQPVELRVHGDVVASTVVAVDAEGATHTFEHAVDQQGAATHVAAVGDAEQTATLEVVEPVSFSVADLEAPGSATVGEDVEVVATVDNDGGPGGAAVTVTVDGEPVHNESVRLGSGDSGTVTASFAPSETGELDVRASAGDDEASATVPVESDTDDGLPWLLVGGGVAALLGVVAAVLRVR